MVQDKRSLYRIDLEMADHLGVLVNSIHYYPNADYRCHCWVGGDHGMGEARGLGVLDAMSEKGEEESCCHQRLIVWASLLMVTNVVMVAEGQL